MGSFLSNSASDVEAIRRFADDGNKYAQFDLGMLYANKIIVHDDNPDVPVKDEWHTVDLNEQALDPDLHGIVTIGKGNPGIYWLSQSAKQWVPRAIHVLAFFIYQHYKVHERKHEKSDRYHDYFLKAAFKLCTIATSLIDDPAYMRPAYQQYAIDVVKLEELLVRIRRDVFDRFILSKLDISDISGDSLDDIITRCNMEVCDCDY